MLHSQKRHFRRNSFSYPTIPIVGNRKHHTRRTWKIGQKSNVDGLVWHRVRFWNIKFSTKQIWIYKIQRVGFWIEKFSKSHVLIEKNISFFWYQLSPERRRRHFLQFLCLLKKHVFQLSTLPPVRFWIKTCPTRRILNWKFVVRSDFELKIFHLFRC